ncbi:MAG: hypothetical protein HZB25_02580 [Candidatus Eisenbacteria bacterium]|nr:hypothetical protein [Candidatus Eisenbacteria bacterium]
MRLHRVLLSAWLCAAATVSAAPATAAPAATKPAGDAYTRARDAFAAGRDAEVLSILTPAVVSKLKYRSHAALWAALARARSGQRDDALAGLAEYRVTGKEGPFIDLVVDFYLGKVPEEEVLARARTERTRLEADFYLGAYHMFVDPVPSRATDLLCGAAISKDTRSSEAVLARALAKALPGGPCAPATAAARRDTTAKAPVAALDPRAPKREPVARQTAPAAKPASPPEAPKEGASESAKGAGEQDAAGTGTPVATERAPRITTLPQAIEADSLVHLEDAIAGYRAAVRDVKDPELAALVRSRIYALTRDLYDERARAMVEHEGLLARDAGPENAVAVSRFENLSDESRWAPLEKGLPALLASDLAQVRRLTVLDRVELETVVGEMKLSRADLFDTSSAPRMGRLLRAGRVVLGAYVFTDDDRVQIEARVVRVATGRVEASGRVSGRSADFFNVEKELLFMLLDRMGVRVSAVEHGTIEKLAPTLDLSAFLAYARGLDQEDRGSWSGAAKAYDEAAGLDPNFREAAAARALMSRGVVTREDIVEAMSRAAAKKPVAHTEPDRRLPGKVPAAPETHARAAEGGGRAAETGERSGAAGAVSRALARAFETDRAAGSGLLPSLETGETHDRRDARPAGEGTVIVTGRIP